MSDAPRASIATILFTDLVGSTELMQRVGDESAQRLFRAHHELLSGAVAATGGSELQWLGDGLMVAFASTADAVRCAIAMQQAAAQQPGERLRVRVGLNVGEVLRQAAGTGSGYFGTPVVMARRLCDQAAAGQIVASAAVAHLLAGRAAFSFRDLGALGLKGIGEEVPACEVVYEAEAVTALLARTPFVGREGEVERLRKLLERTRAGRVALAFLVRRAGNREDPDARVSRIAAPLVRDRRLSGGRREPLAPGGGQGRRGPGECVPRTRARGASLARRVPPRDRARARLGRELHDHDAYRRERALVGRSPRSRGSDRAQPAPEDARSRLPPP